MTTMTLRPLAAAAALSTLLALPASASAHEGDNPRGIALHVGDAFESCYFDLHPQLTRDQFQRFAAEGGQVIRFRQISGADTLGAGVFDVNLGYSYFFLDDSAGAWNNTMSHPRSDHYLGERLGFPLLSLRVGLTRAVDAEAYGSVNPLSNYGFVGVATKIRILQRNIGVPLSVAVRPSVSALLGPSEVQMLNLSADLSVSVRWRGLAPFVGVTFSNTLAIDSSPDTDVGHQGAARATGFVGVDYYWRFLTVGAQAEISDLPGFAVRVGGRI